jgi:hypothetical protein
VLRLVDYDRLFRSYIMDPQAGDNQESFCRTLADEIKFDLRFYDAPPNRANRAIRRAWRQKVTGSTLPVGRTWVRPNLPVKNRMRSKFDARSQQPHGNVMLGLDKTNARANRLGTAIASGTATVGVVGLGNVELARTHDQDRGWKIAYQHMWEPD